MCALVFYGAGEMIWAVVDTMYVYLKSQTAVTLLSVIVALGWVFEAGSPYEAQADL